MENLPCITVGELRRALEIHNDDHELSFSGLTFYRLKQRGPELVQLEFDEVVYRDNEGNLIVQDHSAEVS